MQSKFSEAILEMQQKSGLKYLILEKKIGAMREELEVKEAQLHAVVEQGATKKGKIGSLICDFFINFASSKYTFYMNANPVIWVIRFLG